MPSVISIRTSTDPHVFEVEFDDRQWTGDCAIVGGWCAPRSIELSPAVGAAVLLIQNLASGKIMVDSAKTYAELGEFAVWHCDRREDRGFSKYYYSASVDTKRQFLMPLRRSPAFNGAMFVCLDLPSDSETKTIIDTSIGSMQLQYRRQGLVYQELQRYNIHNRGELPPVIKALACALTGLLRFPHRRR